MKNSSDFNPGQFGIYMLVGCFFILFYLNGFQIIQLSFADGWKMTNAVVEKTTIITTSVPRIGSTTYSPRIDYSYNVSGRKYEGETRRAEALKFNTIEKAKNYLKPFLLRKKVEIKYDPNFPFLSCQFGLKDRSLAYFFIGLSLLLILGAAISFYFFTKMRY